MPDTAKELTVAMRVSSGTAGEVTVLAVSPEIDAPGPPRARMAIPVASPTNEGSAMLLIFESVASLLNSSERLVQSVQPVADFVWIWSVMAPVDVVQRDESPGPPVDDVDSEDSGATGLDS